MEWASIAAAVLSLLVSLASLVLSVRARNDAHATRRELSRHRASHTLQQPEQPASRHSARPGPPPPADLHAAPPTAEMGAVGAMRPRRRVRDDPQA